MFQILLAYLEEHCGVPFHRGREALCYLEANDLISYAHTMSKNLQEGFDINRLVNGFLQLEDTRVMAAQFLSRDHDPWTAALAKSLAHLPLLPLRALSNHDCKIFYFTFCDNQ